MNLDQITTKCWILALFERDDGERLLLGDGWFDFKDSLQHFQPNTFANDVIELQGSDGQMLAGQVRRGAPQSFDGYIGDPITNRQTIEQHRREFLMFFRKRHHYKVVYIFPDGTAIQRKQGYITDAPSVPEIRQKFPEYHVALNFEDVNYYEYAENAQGEEIFSNIRNINISTAATGGLVWDNLGAVSDQMGWKDIATATGQMLTMTNPESIKAPIASFEMTGNIEQATYAGKNLLNVEKTTQTVSGVTFMINEDKTIIANGTASALITFNLINTTFTLASGQYYLSGCPSGGSDSKWRIDINNGADGNQRDYGNGSAFTLSQSTTINNVRIRIASGATLNRLEFKPMISAGSTAQPYEPYVGGQPSPSPTFPQPISTVTGRQTVGIVGKNLYDPNSTVFSVPANVSVEVEGDSVKVTALITTTSSNLYWRTPIPDSMLEDGKTYTISSVPGSGAYRSLRLLLRNHDGSNAGFSTGYSVTYDSRYTLFVVENPFATTGATTINAGTTCTISNIQVEEGSTATAFQSFNGQSYEINLGKNLFDKDNANTLQAGITTTKIESATANRTLWIPCEPNTTYTVQKRNDGDTNRFNVATTAVTPAIDVAVTNRVEQPNASSITYTTSTNAKYLCVQYFRTAETILTEQQVLDSIQIEKGSIASSYSAYFEPIELCKIGTYQDKIYKENGKWWLHKEIGKVVFDGSESYSLLATLATVSRFTANNVVQAIPSSQCCSDHFTWYSNQATNEQFNAVDNEAIHMRGDGVGIGIKINTATASSVNALKTWLASNPTTVYYPLATSTTAEITNEAVLEGLNSAAGLKLFPGQNNIMDQTPSAQPTMTVQYYTALGPGGGLVWESGEAGGATIIEASGLDSAFPLWTVPGPSTNPTLTNITTGQSITWQGTVPAGQTLEIDMDKQTATLAGANVYAFVSGDWIRIDPGPNRMTYVGTGATQASTLSWNNIVG